MNQDLVKNLSKSGSHYSSRNGGGGTRSHSKKLKLLSHMLNKGSSSSVPAQKASSISVRRQSQAVSNHHSIMATIARSKRGQQVRHNNHT